MRWRIGLWSGFDYHPGAEFYLEEDEGRRDLRAMLESSRWKKRLSARITGTALIAVGVFWLLVELGVSGAEALGIAACVAFGSWFLSIP
jgi:hypothetical protein